MLDKNYEELAALSESIDLLDEVLRVSSLRQGETIKQFALYHRSKYVSMCLWNYLACLCRVREGDPDELIKRLYQAGSINRDMKNLLKSIVRACDLLHMYGFGDFKHDSDQVVGVCRLLIGDLREFTDEMVYR
jgi:hypothetical protein